MGADKAVRIDSAQHETDDPLIIARILAAYAKKEGFDLILCGRQAMDDESANVGAMVAEFLNIPHVSQISRLSMLDPGRAEVENEIEGGKKVSEVTLPALFTTQKGLNEPRVPLITGVMKAMKTEITVLDPASFDTPFGPIDDGSSKIRVLSYELPAKEAFGPHRRRRDSRGKGKESRQAAERRSEGPVGRRVSHEQRCSGIC